MQLRAICKSKIHRATVTEANLEYIGSIAVDEDLLRRANIIPGEKVCVWNVNNGERIETYAIPAPAGSGQVIVNGAAARKFREKDQVIIVAFVLTDEVIKPHMIMVDARNRFECDLVDNRRAEERAEGIASADELV
jgi:aspartate 1-decarboxylase